MNLESYQTIEKASEGLYKEKGSKFFSFASPVETEEEFKTFINQLKKDHHQARHHCYSFVMKADKSFYRYSDDGEPNGTAGSPIYGQLQSFNVTNTAIVVVRYFGGTKLGVGGLIQAYKEAAKTALENAIIITKEITQTFSIDFTYEEMNFVMGTIKKFDANVKRQGFDISCQLDVEIGIKLATQFKDSFSIKESIKIKEL